MPPGILTGAGVGVTIVTAFTDTTVLEVFTTPLELAVNLNSYCPATEGMNVACRVVALDNVIGKPDVCYHK